MTFEQIISDLKNKVYKPIYYLYGEEHYFIDEVSNFVAANVLGDVEKEFNQTILYGKDIEVHDIISVAKKFPMMANYNVVIVKEAQNIKKIENLSSYLDKPLNSTILVLSIKLKPNDTKKGLDKRTKFAKQLESMGVLFESKRIYNDKIPDWIVSYMKQSGYKISIKASILINEFLGNDLSKIVNELKKLQIVTEKSQEITEKQIEENIGISKDFNHFELNDALARKDILKANQIINYFASNSKNFPLVLSVIMLFDFFSKVLQTHFVKDKSDRNLASELGVNPYFVKIYIVASKNYSVVKLSRIISYLRECDAKAKGVDNYSTTEEELLKELIFKILH